MSTDRSWRAFADGLAGLEGLAGEDPAGGYAHLGVLLETALRWSLAADPDYPRFVQMNDTPEVADNLFAAVRAEAIYRISGDIAGLFDINISIHEGWNFLGKPKVWGDLGREALQVDAQGRFELVLGGELRSGNWLPLPAEAAIVHIREYYADWSEPRPGRFDIQRIDAGEQAPPRPTPRDIGSRLEEARAYVEGYTAFHKRILETRFPPANTLTEARSQPAGNRNIAYSFGRFELGGDEALVISFDAPVARLWSLQWLTSPWYETVDLHHRLTGLVGAEAPADPDGKVRVVLSARDPGLRNWLDVGGYPQGVFVLRFIWCEEPPAPSISLVPAVSLAGRDWAGGPFVAAERAAQLDRRRRHFAGRRR